MFFCHAQQPVPTLLDPPVAQDETATTWATKACQPLSRSCEFVKVGRKCCILQHFRGSYDHGMANNVLTLFLCTHFLVNRSWPQGVSVEISSHFHSRASPIIVHTFTLTAPRERQDRPLQFIVHFTRYGTTHIFKLVKQRACVEASVLSLASQEVIHKPCQNECS